MSLDSLQTQEKLLEIANDRPPATPTKSKRKKRSRARGILPPLILFGIMIGLWYIVSYGFMDANRRKVVLPAPHVVVRDGFWIWDDRRGIRPIICGTVSSVSVISPGPSMYSLLDQRHLVRGRRAWSLSRAPPLLTISASPALPSVPKVKEPSDGRSEGCGRCGCRSGPPPTATSQPPASSVSPSATNRARREMLRTTIHDRSSAPTRPGATGRTSAAAWWPKQPAKH